MADPPDKPAIYEVASCKASTTVQHIGSKRLAVNFTTGNELAEYISGATEELIMTTQSDRCSWHNKNMIVAFCWACSYNCTYERRIGSDFLVRYEGDSGDTSGRSLYVEGPLAELNWSGFADLYHG
jgi:hypothetical protein